MLELWTSSGPISLHVDDLKAGAAALEEVERLREEAQRAAKESFEWQKENQKIHDKWLRAREEGDQLRARVAELEAAANGACRCAACMDLVPRLNSDLAASRARVEVLERACAAPEHCFEHEDNCCSEWCKSCQEGKQGAALRCAALAGDGKGGP